MKRPLKPIREFYAANRVLGVIVLVLGVALTAGVVVLGRSSPVGAVILLAVIGIIVGVVIGATGAADDG